MDEAVSLPEYEMRLILLPEMATPVLQSLHSPARVFEGEEFMIALDKRRGRRRGVPGGHTDEQ
jgi:hypothetical protein